jgi:orotidine-5'-phosphate decarboxylase
MPTVAAPKQATTFQDRMAARSMAIDSLLCIGLDPILESLPDSIARSPEGAYQFCREIVRATSDYALAYKPNLGFFVALGRAGLDVLYRLRADIPAGIPVVLDCKVNDMGATADHYARGWFGELDVDAITVAPFMGEDAVAPYLDRPDKGVFILTKTSNPGSGQLQDQLLATGDPLYIHVARLCQEWDNRYPAHVGLVVGATYPQTLRDIREQSPNQWILLPGIGAQGGSLEESLRSGLNWNGSGLLISASRSILYASSGSDYAQASASAAAELVEQIRAVRQRIA